MGKEEVKYFLYSKDRRNVEISENNTEAIPDYRNYIFVIHGWRSGRNKTWVENITDVILNVNNLAVIQVDWSEPADDLYALAVCNVREVGKHIASFFPKFYFLLYLPRQFLFSRWP